MIPNQQRTAERSKEWYQSNRDFSCLPISRALRLKNFYRTLMFWLYPRSGWE